MTEDIKAIQEETDKKSKKEEFKVKSNKLLEKIKSLIKEGNVRKIIVKDKNDKTIASFPLTFGVVGTVIAPFLIAAGAVTSLATECTIIVEKKK